MSPLEAENPSDIKEPELALRDNRIDFSLRAHANPNNSTATTQSLAARVLLEKDAEFQLSICGQDHVVSAERLLSGAVSGNLGLIDTPAFRLHPLPRPEDWQWSGSVDIGRLTPGDWVNIRVKQKNGQFAITSPFHCRA